MSDLTPETLAELKRLEQAATKDWEVVAEFNIQSPREGTDMVSITGASCNVPGLSEKWDAWNRANAKAGAALRNAAPALIGAAEECERLRGLLRECEWGDHATDWAGDEWDVCPCCGGCRAPADPSKTFNNGRRKISHYEGCNLAAAIKGT